jgi:hypothetical protein
MSINDSRINLLAKFALLSSQMQETASSKSPDKHRAIGMNNNAVTVV